MSTLTVKQIERLIYPVSFYRYKARYIKATCAKLLKDFGGRTPGTMEELLTLPGVGRKTANVVLNIAFGEKTIAVDTHVFRVSNRTGIAPGEDVRAVEDKLMKVVPERFKLHAHHWLILHGRYICLARKPGCPECLINDLCQYKAKTIPETAVRAPKRKSG